MVENLKLTNVWAGYGDVIVLQDVSVCFRKGVNMILGPNGSGKTTLLRVCAGVLRPFRGDVYVEDLPLTCARPVIGYLPHTDALLKELTVIENLLFYAKLLRVNECKFFRRVRELCDLLEISHLLKVRVSRLSRGQRRKVAIVRTFIVNPEVLILDEPCVGLDPSSVESFYRLVRKLDTVVVCTTHIIEEAERYADRVFIMREGKIIEECSPDEVRSKVMFLGGG